MKHLLYTLALCSSVATSHAVSYGVAESSFAGSTRESFHGQYIQVADDLDFGNGLVFIHESGGAVVNYTAGYGMGLSTTVYSGRDGAGDGYFGTFSSPATFSFQFAGGITQFGFSGAEAVLPQAPIYDGLMTLRFFDLSDGLLGSHTIDTNGAFAWAQWHGFSSMTPIGRVLFDTVGHSVLDDVSFGAAPVSQVPDSGVTGWLSGLVLFGLAALRRRLT